MTKKITNFTDLDTWQKAHGLRIKVLKMLTDFPDVYKYGLESQMQRSSVSIGSNIAEGFGRKNVAEKLQFNNYAKGSLTELQDQLIVTQGIGLISERKFKKLTKESVEVHKLLNGLIRSTKKFNENRDSSNKELNNE